MTWAYLKRAHTQNVRHTKIFFDPQLHTNRGISFETVITGIHRALVDAQQRLGITSKLLYPDITKEAWKDTKEILFPYHLLECNKQQILR